MGSRRQSINVGTNTDELRAFARTHDNWAARLRRSGNRPGGRRRSGSGCSGCCGSGIGRDGTRATASCSPFAPFDVLRRVKNVYSDCACCLRLLGSWNEPRSDEVVCTGVLWFRASPDSCHSLCCFVWPATLSPLQVPRSCPAWPR